MGTPIHAALRSRVNPRGKPGIRGRSGMDRVGSLTRLDSPVAGRLALGNRKQDCRSLDIGTARSRRWDNRNKCPVAAEA